MPALGRVGRAALLTAVARQGLRRSASWDRTNHRGATVSLFSGPALAVGASRGPAGLVAGWGAAALGAYDDAVGARPGQQAKGLSGHAAALRDGRLTSGGVKVAGLGLTGLVASALVPRRPGSSRTAAGVVVGGAVVAGAANLLNLLDLRPGRALKVATAWGVLQGQPEVVGASLALLPDDLSERDMLGDTGANAVGALLGVGLLRRVPWTGGRLVVLAVLSGLTVASERVSFSAVIDAHPVLSRLDRAGRRT